MRRRTRAAVAAAAGALLAATAAPAGAAVATDARSGGQTARPGAVGWSVQHGTASASGERWTEPGVAGVFGTLVIRGELSNTGDGCYSLWIRYTYDLAPAVPREYAEVCGAGSTGIALRHSYMPTTTGYLTVCRGTGTTDDCAPWQSITRWPADQG